MGWGTDFNSNIYLHKEMYSSIYEVEDKIEDLKLNIDDLQSKIKMFASSNPKDIIPNEWNDTPINWLNNELNEILHSYEEDLIHRNKLSLYLDFLNENNIKNIDHNDYSNESEFDDFNSLGNTQFNPNEVIDSSKEEDLPF